MRHLFVCLPLWAALCLQLNAQERSYKERVENNESARFRGMAGHSKPLVELPRHVPMTEGEVFLWADFQADATEGVPLYLVNASLEDQTFPTQDRNLFIHLEFKDEAGAWQRAQAHLSSWCGNSYFSVSLPARHFFEIRGYRPAKGTPRTVRYANQRQKLLSNEGAGMINEEDLWAVAHDSFTESEVPYWLRNVITIRQDVPPPESATLAGKAEIVRALAWLPRNEPLLEQMRAFQTWVKSAESGPEKEELLKELVAFFDRVDEAKPDRLQLTGICLRVLAGGKESAPEMSQETAWLLLRGTAFDGDSRMLPEMSAIPQEDWKAVIPAAVNLLKSEAASKNTTDMAALVLSTQWLADSLVKNEELEDWLVSSSASLRGIGARALSRRSQFSKLVEIAQQRPGPEQIVILQALAQLDHRPDGLLYGIDRARQPDYSSGEHDFWRHCASTMPLETAVALWSYKFIRAEPPFNRLIHDPLRAFWQNEAARGQQVHELPDQGYAHRIALQFLDSWQMQEDDEIFTALLNHGGHTLQKVYSFEGIREHVTSRTYPIREIAKQALLKRNRPVPDDLVTEEVVSRMPVEESDLQEQPAGIPPTPTTKRRELIPGPKK